MNGVCFWKSVLGLLLCFLGGGEFQCFIKWCVLSFFEVFV